MDEREKPSLLYICPVAPSLGGNGLAMRCGMVLEALASARRVSLLTVPLYPPFGQPIPDYFARLCERAAVASPEEAASVYRDAVFEAVHVFRLAALPFARGYFGDARSRLRCLDLDDIESRTHLRIASLYRANGDARQSDAVAAEAKRYQLLEGLAFRMVDRVYVCSARDRQLLLDRCPAELAILPNAVRPPAAPSRRRPGTFRFLFLGTLGYYPNQDAVLWFCSSILPRILRGTSVPFTVDIAGRGAPDSLRAAIASAGAHFVGEVDEVQPAYDAAHAVIVPLRAGGGTRIKILEAFSYGRPVVTTPAGIEGIEAVPGVHALTEESPEGFAAACTRLMTDWELGERLALNAASLCARFYSIAAMKAAVSSPTEPPAPRGSRPAGVRPAPK